MSELDDIKRSLTEDQQKVYDVLLGNIERLKSDWNGCRMRYDEAYKVINDPSTGPKVRLFLKNIATYWVRRKQAMESMLETTGNDELLKQWKKEVYDEKHEA